MTGVSTGEAVMIMSCCDMQIESYKNHAKRHRGDIIRAAGDM